MKINHLKINHYGKLENKEIELENSINIIYGKNEAGKSTLLNFILNSFYGISKNKKGKDISDYEKYKPWIGEDFSGKIEYELDNKNKYEVYRDFNKKNPQIYNEKKEEISKQFAIDKTKGNEFFYEQTKIDEELFKSTLLVGQQEVKLERANQNILIQKIANLVGTGEDNVSYKRALDRLNRRQLDEIGTARSREKPINLLEQKIKEIEEEKEKLEKFQNVKYQIEEKRNYLLTEISNQEQENQLVKEIKLLREKESIEKEKIYLQENLKTENQKQIKIVENEIEEINQNYKNNLEKNKKINTEKNKLNKKTIILFLIILIINLFQFLIIKNKIINYIFLLTVPMLLIYYLFSKNKINNKLKNNKEIINQINLEINNLNNEIKILKNNNLNLEKEIEKLNYNINLKINLEKEKIKKQHMEKIGIQKIEDLFQLENINYEISRLLEKCNQKKLELHSLDLDTKNIEPALENLSKLEEDLVANNEKYVNLKNLEKSMNLAREVLDHCYDEMKNTVTPKFTQNLSQTIAEITNGKYTNVRLNDESGLVVELENGNYVPAERLSAGTIDQLYLSLRLSMVNELSEESMPIILDESFAYYDKDRLENILKFLAEKFADRQIIIFTCTHREQNILNELGISYQLCYL